MKAYAVTGAIYKDGVTHSFPTFFLSVDVQGIVSADHARRIATNVINPLELENVTCYVTVEEVEV